jgi:hypothetical protein
VWINASMKLAWNLGANEEKVSVHGQGSREHQAGAQVQSSSLWQCEQVLVFQYMWPHVTTWDEKGDTQREQVKKFGWNLDEISRDKFLFEI